MNTKKVLLTGAFTLALTAAPSFAQGTMNNQPMPGSSSSQGTMQGSSMQTGSPMQDSTMPDSTMQTATRNVTAGQKEKLRGVIVRRDVDTFIMRDERSNADVVVRLTDDTRVTERKSNPFRGAKNYGITSVLRGLPVEVEGTGDSSGQLVARRIRVSDNDLKIARSIDSTITPVEGRVGRAEGRLGQVEQNAERLSGQLDELAAISNAARGGAKAAQESADMALAGVAATNDRISALDDYVTQETAVVNFRTGRYDISPESKTALDSIAQKYFSAKNYVIEITGYADSTGSIEQNRRLSQRRADAVVRYLAEQHRIPLRRMVTPFGYGESQPIADDTTRDGRAQNRRVEVKVLVNRGLQQGAPNTTLPNTTATTSSGVE